MRALVYLFTGLCLAASTPVLAQMDVQVYSDSLLNGWQNWSWATVNLANSQPVHSGSRSIGVSAGPWQAAGSGTKIGSYFLHLSDGRQEEFPIIYGQDVRDWVPDSGNPVDGQGGKVAWRGEKTNRRVYLSTWENRRPDVEIETLDFVSAKTRCGPFLIGITTE